VAIVDPFNKVENESDELNNTSTRSVLVTGGLVVTPIITNTPTGLSCEEQCAVQRDICMDDGLLLLRQCVQIFQSCINRCP